MLTRTGLKVRISSRAITNNGVVREKITNSGIDLIAISLTSGIVRPPPPPPLFLYRGIEFLKFGNKGGDNRFFLQREGLERKDSLL